MLTEALRAFVLRTAWEMDQGGYSSVNTVLVMNLSSDIIQEVTGLNMAIHGAAGFSMNAEASKLVRDGIIWTHLAGDTSQRLKVIRRFPKK
jgi:alkylation response protein AidB-like acyl-CoA dehydrogenase